MIILHYDEFGIYLTTEDVRAYVVQLIEEGITLENDVVEKCLDYFGFMHKSLIEKALYED